MTNFVLGLELLVVLSGCAGTGAIGRFLPKGGKMLRTDGTGVVAPITVLRTGRMAVEIEDWTLGESAKKSGRPADVVRQLESEGLGGVHAAVVLVATDAGIENGSNILLLAESKEGKEWGRHQRDGCEWWNRVKEFGPARAVVEAVRNCQNGNPDEVMSTTQWQSGEGIVECSAHVLNREVLIYTRQRIE